uniref:Uncharacterized protein n=1 Tax=Strongyloides venezuelensis TaxID=75913 RepID=A0A0K0G2E8_STRVS
MTNDRYMRQFSRQMYYNDPLPLRSFSGSYSQRSSSFFSKNSQCTSCKEIKEQLRKLEEKYDKHFVQLEDMIGILKEKIFSKNTMKTRKSRSMNTVNTWRITVGKNEYFIEQVTKEVLLGGIEGIEG